MPNPTPQRQNNREWPTPRVEDILFFELKEVSRVCPPGVTPPAYGTAHPNATLYPSHTLCFIENAEDQGGWQKWWYVADRESQHTYNYELEYPSGDPRYPRITRQYVVPRGTAPISLGTADVASVYATESFYLTDTGGYYTSGGDAYVFSDAVTGVLIAQSETPIEGQIGSLYVRQTRIYEVIPGSDDSVTGSGQTQNTGGYTISRPIEDKDFLRLVWKITLPRTTADGYRAVPHVNCLIPGYENLILVDEEIKADEDNDQKSSLIRVYQGNITGAQHPSPAVVKRDRDVLHILPPDKFLTTVTARVEVRDITSPADLAIDDVTASSGTLMSVKVDPKGTITGKQLVESAERGAIQTLTGKSWDDNLRDYVPYTVTVMTPAAAAALTETAGQEMTLTPLNANWTMVTIESPRTTLLTDASRNYQTTMPFSWPPVLTWLYWTFLPRKYPRGGDVANGYNEFFYDYDMKPAWSGICRASVSVAWSPTLPILPVAIEALDPQGFSINWPGVNLRLPPCLHPVIGPIAMTTGTAHPDYTYLGFTKTIAATSYTDWPASLIADYDVKPYKGGFLQKKVVVYKPY